jgi:hypothetical protein
MLLGIHCDTLALVSNLLCEEKIRYFQPVKAVEGSRATTGPKSSMVGQC